MLELCATVLATVLSCAALGLRLLELFRFHGAPRLERVAAAFGLGLGALGILTLVLGMLGIVGPAPAAGLLSIFFFLGLGPLARLFRTEPRQSEPSNAGRALSELRKKRMVSVAATFLVVVCVALTVLYLLTAFLPPLDYDDLEYHLGAPAEYMRAGKVCFVPWNVYAQFPQVVEMSYLHAMWLHGAGVRGVVHGRLVNIAAAVMTVLATFSLARCWLSVELSLLSATLFYSAPLYGMLAAVSYVEIPLTFYTVLATASLLRAYREKTCTAGVPPAASSLLHAPREKTACAGKWIVLGGTFAGLAVGCKYTAAALTALPLAVACVFAGVLAFRARHKTPAGSAERGPDAAREGALRTILGPPAVFGLSCILVTSPWLVRNALWAGNPVYPFLYPLFGGGHWDAMRDAKFRQAHEPYARFRASQAAAPSARTDANMPGNRLEVLCHELSEAIAGTAESPPTLPTSLVIPILLALLHFFSRRPLSRLAEGVAACQSVPPSAGQQRQQAAEETQLYSCGFVLLFCFALFYFFSWAALTHIVGRFLVPLLPVLGILSASGAQVTRSRRVRGILVAVMLAISAVYVWEAGNRYLDTISCAHDEETRRKFYAENEDALPRAALRALEAEWKDASGAGDSLAVFVGEARAFECRYPCIAPTVFDKHPLEGLFNGAAGGEELEGRLERLFPQSRLALVVSHGELERLGNTYRFVFEGKEHPGLPTLWDSERWSDVLERGKWRRIYASPRGVIEVFVRGQ